MHRRLIAILALALVVAGCSSSSEDATSTTVMTTIPAGVVVPTVDEMCRTLSLLYNSATPPGNASEGMMATDLADASPAEMAAYGDVLVAAPQSTCPEFAQYADVVAYWLGF
jgi:hypothetical protein